MAVTKLMTPLMLNGSFNRVGQKICAAYHCDVSDGAYTYRLWTQTGKPNTGYPREANDRYYLYVELGGYLVSLSMTEYDLITACGYRPAMQELYGGEQARQALFDGLRGDAVREALAAERAAVARLGKASACQAAYIHGVLSSHLQRYTASKENGGETFPDYIGALMADELDHCMQLAKIYSAHQAQIVTVMLGPIRCLIPGFDGAIFSHEWKEALGGRFYTAAPRRSIQSVEQYRIVKRA